MRRNLGGMLGAGADNRFLPLDVYLRLDVAKRMCMRELEYVHHKLIAH
jgi:hypothetical protein